jgi:hypothetical protein
MLAILHALVAEASPREVRIGLPWTLTLLDTSI